MRVFKAAIVFGVILSVVCLTWTGCSDDNSALNPAQTSRSTGIAAFFPTEEGYTTIYEVEYSNGVTKQVKYEAGDEVDMAGTSVIELFYSDNGRRDTGYVRYTDDAVYHYASKTSDPEKVLELPFTIGKSWEKNDFEEPEDLTDSIEVEDPDINKSDDDINNNDDNKGIDTDGPENSLPLSNSITMSVAGKQPITLDNDDYYTEAVKIVSVGAGGQINYYWYVTGIGLVKFVIDAEDGSEANGAQVGELKSYGF